MRRLRPLLAFLALTAASPALAEGGLSGLFDQRVTLGYGRMFDNDFFGDNNDRWRTGSYAWSIIRGQGWDGRRPVTPGEILEYRFRMEMIAPGKLSGPGSDDRPYVGALSAGVHTHFERGDFDYSIGLDAVITGPQTGVGELQKWFHQIVSAPTPKVLDDQIGNAVHPTLTAEVARPFRMSDTLTIRPFAEVQAGVENIGRVGGDVILGNVGHHDLLLRDVPTGQLYRGIEGPYSGFGYVLGADFAAVGDSAYLPADRVTATETRTRVRAGINWQLAENASFYYGLTWLSPEFEGQPEGQLIGGLKLNFNF